MELKKQKVYKKVYDMAREELLNSSIEERLTKSGLEYEGRGGEFHVGVPYFDETIDLGIPAFSFKSNRGANVTLVTKIIVLHYINRASGHAPGALENRIPYEDIPGGRHYLPVYEKRVSKPLEGAFGFNRHLFLEAGISLGGNREELGDASFTLFPLPMVPITFILWEGDEEFPPSVKVLFDPSIPGYLSLEDTVVLSKLAATRIIKTARLQGADE